MLTARQNHSTVNRILALLIASVSQRSPGIHLEQKDSQFCFAKERSGLCSINLMLFPVQQVITQPELSQILYNIIITIGIIRPEI